VQTAWPASLGSALKTPWLALSGPLLSSYAQTGADSMAVSGLRFENALVGSEWAH